MADFTGTLSPDVANVGDTLTLDFTSPDNADNVVATIVEVDRPEFGESGPDELVGRFFGKIEDGTFKLVPRKKGDNPEKNPKAGKDAPKIKVEVDGKAFELDLPGRGKENGVFELAIRATAGKKAFNSKKIVFVRDFQFMINGELRPVITFVTDVDTKENPFMSAAAAFWKHHSDAVFNRPGTSMEFVLTFLREKNEAFGNWGQINIVSHGNIIQILMRLFSKGDSKLLLVHKLDEVFDKNPESRDLSTLVAAGLDDKSQVVFRACEAGNHQGLLDAIRTRLLGDNGTLFIPKFVQGYPSDGSSEFFEEMFHFFVPGKAAPAAKTIEDTIKDQFKKKYPDGDWDVEKATLKSHDRVVTFSGTLTLGEELLYSDQKTGKLKTNAELVDDFKKFWTDENLESDDSTWLTKPDEWDIQIASKKEVKNPVDDYLFEVHGAGTPKIAVFGSGTVTLGSDPGNDIAITAKGVAAHHATVTVNGADLEIANVDGQRVTVTAGGRVFSLPPRGSTEASMTANGSCTVQLASTAGASLASVALHHPRFFDVHFDCNRYWVQRRRLLREFDKTKAYKDRDPVRPDLTNSDHYGTAG